MTRFAPLLFALAACTKPAASDVAVEQGLAVLGAGSHDVSLKIEKLGGKADGLNHPTDLAFDPDVPGRLWVVNKDDDSASIFHDVGTPDQTSEHRIDPFAMHFMEQVTSISFGAPGTFGTCQDGTNTYNGATSGNNFTGPTLWSSDLDVFAYSNPAAVDALTDMFGYYTDLGSHLDMLHESPECMGIAWQRANVYWVFDGYHGSINRYDFKEDHGVGWDDHSDGVIARWVEGEVRRKKNVVSHLVFDHDTDLLYIADTGNQRIAVLDTKSGRRGSALYAMEPGTDHHTWENGDLWTLVDGATVGLEEPAGLALVDGTLFTTDAATGEIFAFDLDGNLIDHASTGLPERALGGIVAPSADELWFVASKGNALYRLRP